MSAAATSRSPSELQTCTRMKLGRETRQTLQPGHDLPRAPARTAPAPANDEGAKLVLSVRLQNLGRSSDRAYLKEQHARPRCTISATRHPKNRYIAKRLLASTLRNPLISTWTCTKVETLVEQIPPLKKEGVPSIRAPPASAGNRCKGRSGVINKGWGPFPVAVW